MQKPESVQKNETHKIPLDSETQMDYRNPTRRPDLVLDNKKNNLLSSDFCSSEGPQKENERKHNDGQMLRPFKRTRKTMEHEGFGGTSCSWCTWNSPQRLGRKGLEVLKIDERIKTI